MSFQSDLLSVLKKYPFIHIDLSGQLSIIVPLTGAQRIMEHFSTTLDESRSLYLFGDNTCKSDLERKNFFSGKYIHGRWNNAQYIPGRYDPEPFGELFNKLISDLQRLKYNRNDSDVIFLDTILNSLKSQKEAVDLFTAGNPDLMHMKMDLMKQNEFCISKGEFVVAMEPDTARYLDLPNFRSVVNPREVTSKKIIDVSSIPVCLSALANIKIPTHSDKRADLISDALKQVSFAAYNLRFHNNWITLLRTVYASMRQKNQSLPKELPNDGHLKELLEYLGVYDHNNDLWDDESARDTAEGVLRQVIGMGFCEKQEVTDFTSCYQLAFPDYCQMNEGAFDEGNLARTQSYQLFVLQTFLYLSAMQMHLKGDKCAKNFLEIIQRPSSLKTIVDTLCRNESSFKSWMQKHFQISAEEYQKIAIATHEIATAHLEVPHYDETRIACISEQVHDSKYTVMAGRLCWSAIPLTEYSSIDSLAKQANAMEQNFQVFIEKRQDYVSHDAIYNDMLEQLDAGDAYDLIEANIPYLPQVYKEFVLTRAVAKNRMPCIEFLLKQQIYVPKVFNDIYAARLFNRELVEMFFKHDSRYVAQVSVDKLIYAVQVDDFETVKFFVTYCPGLINDKGASSGLTVLMCVDSDNSQLFEYLMDNGIDINTPESRGLFTAAHLATRGASAKTKALFHNYHQNLEHKFQNNPDHATKFTMGHLVNAVDNMDTKLVILLLRYCPHIVNELEPNFLNHINNMQKKLFLVEFKMLLSTLNELKSKNNPSYRKKAAAAYALYAELDKAGQQFFGTRINAESHDLFKQRCDKALEKAKPVFAEHRGWYSYSQALRGFLGVVSALTIIPALCVQFASKDGYANTFFGKQEQIKTNTVYKLEKAENNLHQNTAQLLFI